MMNPFKYFYLSIIELKCKRFSVQDFFAIFIRRIEISVKIWFSYSIFPSIWNKETKLLPLIRFYDDN